MYQFRVAVIVHLVFTFRGNQEQFIAASHWDMQQIYNAISKVEYT